MHNFSQAHWTKGTANRVGWPNRFFFNKLFSILQRDIYNFLVSLKRINFEIKTILYSNNFHYSIFVATNHKNKSNKVPTKKKHGFFF